MKGKLSILLMVIFVFSLTTVSFAARGVLPKNENSEYDIVVSQAGDGDYSTIQEAIDNAEEGTTIFVKAGEYEESVSIDIDGIKLIGEGPDKVKIISSNGNSALSISDVNNIEVTGFTFIYEPPENDEGNACVFIGDSENITFYNNIIKGATFSGLELSGLRNSKIYNITSEDNKQSGIFVNNGATDLLIYSNISRNNGYHGIEISEDGSAPIVINNVFEGNKESGMYIHDYARPVVKNNEIKDNNHAGISVSDYAYPVIFGNKIVSNKEDGIYVYGNGRAQVEDNLISKNGISGVAFSNASGVVIGNSISESKQFGVDLYTKAADDVEDEYNVVVMKNLVEKNGYSGIGIGGSILYATIAENKIKDNTEDGVLAYSGAKVNLLNNLIIGSKLNAIEARKEAVVYATNNTLVKNNTGIYTHDNALGVYNYNVIAFNDLGISYSEKSLGLNIVHIMNVYWKNKEVAKGIKLGEKNYEEDPGFIDAENGNYKINKDSKFSRWGY